MNAWLEIGLSNALVATALALAAWLVTRVVRRADVVFFIWLIVLVKLVSPPLVSIPWEVAPTRESFAVKGAEDDGAAMTSIGERTDHVATPVPGREFAMIAGDATREATMAPSPPSLVKPTTGGWRLHDLSDSVAQLVPLVGCIWLTGSVCWFALAAIRIVRFGRLLRRAEPAPTGWQAEAESLAHRMGLRRVVRVRLLTRQIPPLVWSLTGNATLLLPAELVRALSAEQRSTLLAHELAHVQRRAYLVSWLEIVTLGLYWWHPVAWWARRRIEQAEEHCCDARVLALLPGLARPYAKTLLATVGFLSDARPALPLGARGFSQTRHVKRRLGASA
jgi:beta-lactamase regulating signal transducer with metallopeptidase domain